MVSRRWSDRREARGSKMPLLYARCSESESESDSELVVKIFFIVSLSSSKR